MIPKEISIKDLNEVASSNWKYILYRYNDDFVLSVLCGTVGVFDVNIELDKEEKAKYLSEGIDFINNLSYKVSGSPTSYSDRRINIHDD